VSRRLLKLLAGVAGAGALLSAPACETEFPGTPPPGECAPGDKVCFHEPNSDRTYVLRCNDFEVDGAIWLIDVVCTEQQVCEIDQCVDSNQ